jgi:hypothetical protein
MQGQWFFRSRAGGQQFSVGSRKSEISGRAAAPARISWGELNVLRRGANKMESPLPLGASTSTLAGVA